MQGRGLKQYHWNDCRDDEASPLMQGRGLKHIGKFFPYADTVAPHAGAWIETLP